MKTTFYKGKSSQARFKNFDIQAFTLIEVLLSMVILASIMLIVTQVIGAAQRSWKAASSRVSQFREARTAFDAVSRGIRQATMPTYRDWDYTGNGQFYPNQFIDVPRYIRSYADVGFVAGRAADLVEGGSGDRYPGHGVLFIAPMGKTSRPELQRLPSLLNVRGYFVKFGTDAEYLPISLASRLQPKSRYRLYEYRPPAEQPADHGQSTDSLATEVWAKVSNKGNNLVPIAENIVTLVFGFSFAADSNTQAPDLASSPTASSGKLPFVSHYNSFDAGKPIDGVPQLPHSVQIIMVALDEESATRLAQQNGSSPPSVLTRAGSAFRDPASYDRDIKTLTKAMQELRLNYRVFSSIISVPGSKT